MMSTLTADGDDQRVEAKRLFETKPFHEAAKSHIGEFTKKVVEKETESEVERVQATKELNQFIENSAEKNTKSDDTVEEEDSEQTSEEQGSTAEAETSSSGESKHEIEYEKLDTPCPSLMAGSPGDFEPTFEQEAKEIQNEIMSTSSTENWTEKVVEKVEPEQIEEVQQIEEQQKIDQQNTKEKTQIEFEDLPELDATADSYATANNITNPLENTTFNFSEKKFSGRIRRR
jgi:hypothetical protein